jgi:hypothetical protein
MDFESGEKVERLRTGLSRIDGSGRLAVEPAMARGGSGRALSAASNGSRAAPACKGRETSSCRRIVTISPARA